MAEEFDEFTCDAGSFQTYVTESGYPLVAHQNGDIFVFYGGRWLKHSVSCGTDIWSCEPVPKFIPTWAPSLEGQA